MSVVSCVSACVVFCCFIVTPSVSRGLAPPPPLLPPWRVHDTSHRTTTLDGTVVSALVGLPDN
eukprot:5934643-Prymnesium_polylepis.1